MDKAAICSFKAQTGHPPCCDPVEFVIPGLDSVHFVAWGTTEGFVDVGYFEIDPQGKQADLKVLLSLQVGRCGAELSESRAKGSGELPDSAVLCLKYGGGPHVLICAATKSDIAVFKLDCMVQELVSSWSWSDGNSSQLFVCRASLSEGDGTIIGMSWTNQLDGILVSDSRSQLRMWKVSTEEYGKSMEVCWEAEASEPQDILSAGVSISSPSASACSYGEFVATVWWPKVADNQLVHGKKARPEKLKHSCHVKHVDWSPGLLSKDIMGHPAGTLEAHASDEEVQSNRQYTDNEECTNPDDHPAIMTLDEEGGIRIWVEMLVVQQGPEDDKPTLDSYFAMTLHIESGKSSASRIPFQNMIPGLGRSDHKDRVQFCIWARPMDSILGQTSQVNSTKAPVWWLVSGSQVGSGSRADSQKSKLLRLRLYAVRGLSAVVISSMHGRLSGASTLSTGSKRPQAILWGEHLWEINDAFDFSDSQSAKGLLSVVAARVSRSDDFPTITCFAAVCNKSEPHHTHVCLHGCGTTLITSFTDPHAPNSPTSVHQRLEMNHIWEGQASINIPEILQVAVVNNLVTSVDCFGNISLWYFDKDRNGIILMDSNAVNHVGTGPTYSNCVIQMVTVNRECEVKQAISDQNQCICAIVTIALDSLFQVGAICEEQKDKGSSSFKLMVLGSIDLPGEALVHEIIVHSRDESNNRLLASFGVVSAHGPSTVCVNMCAVEYIEDKADNQISFRYEDMPCCKLQETSPSKIISVCKGRKGDLLAVISKFDVYSLYYIRDISHETKLVLEDFKVILSPKEDCIPENLHLMDYDSKRDLLALAGKRSIKILDLDHARKMKDASNSVGIRHSGDQGIKLPEHDVSSMRWLPAEVVPVLAVGFENGSVHMYSYRHSSISCTWALVGALKTQIPVPIQMSCSDILILSFGNTFGVLSKKVLIGHESVSLGRYLISASGPLPQYHPKYLRSLLVSGNIKGFESIMKSYASWMTEMGANLDNPQRQDSLDLSGFLSPKSNHSSGGHLSVEHPPGIMQVFPRVPIHVMAKSEAINLKQKVDSFIAKAKSSDQVHQPKHKTSLNDAFESKFTVKNAIPPQDTGMLDMSAFGMTDMLQGETKSQTSSHDTGMLDMSAFGMTDMLQGEIRPSVARETDVETLYFDPQVASHDRNHKKIELKSLRKVQSSDHDSLLELICTALDLTCTFVGINANVELTSISEAYILSPVPGLSREESSILIKALNGVKSLQGIQVSNLDMPALLFLMIVSFQTPLLSSCESSSTCCQSSGKGKKLGPTTSMRNAAGVEYTLAPSLARESESDNSDLNSPPESLSKNVGLGQGVTLSSVIWLILSSTTEEMMSIGAEVLSYLDFTDDTSHHPNDSKDHSFISKFDHGKGKIDWTFLRSIGIAFWLKDELALRKVLENLARVEFKKSRDPDNVALFYAILGKFEVLKGIYRTVNRQKESDFLARDLKLEKNKEAACKNAFVLLGQHRYNLAATFFLLGGKPDDAIEVCATKIRDFQLTLLLCRLLKSENSQNRISAYFTELMPRSEEPSWRLLRSWLADDCMGCITSCTQSLGDSGTGSNEWIVEFLSHYFDMVVPCSSATPDIEAELILSDCQTVCRSLSHEMIRGGLHAMGVQFALIGSHCNTGPTSQKLQVDAIDACAASLVDHPISFLPDNALDEVFHFNIEKYISELHGLENIGASFSVNKMLHQIEWYYKALSISSVQMAGTPKDISQDVLAKMASMDATGYANSTASSIRVNSFDDNPILTHFRSRAKLATDDSEASDRQIIYAKSVEIFRVDGDSLHAVCSCPLLAPDMNGRLLAVSSHRNGVLEFATHRDIAYSQEGSLHVQDNGEGFQEEETAESPAARSGMFSRLVSQIFDQASWVTDPLEDSAHYMIDGDVGVAVSSSMRFSAGQSESMQSQSPTRRHGDAQATHSKLLASHPSRQIFLSDCNDSGRILLWQYDGPRFLSLFTPMPYSDLRQLQSNADVFSFSTKISRSTTLTSRMSNWGGAVDISFSDNGERFAAIGDGGVVAVWRLSGGSARHSDVDGAFCSEWWNQCITKQGRAVSFVGGSCVVVVAAGADPKGNISLWDTVSPRSESCIGYLSQHKHPVNCLQTLPGGWLLASADDKGALSVSDVRMIGSSSNKARTLWNVRASRGKICAIKTLPLDRIQMQPRKLALSAGHGTGTGLVTAGDDGIVRIWDASSGKLVQETDPVYEKTPRAHGLLHLRSGENKYSITDLSVCDEGIITCGTDGIVRLYPKLD